MANARLITIILLAVCSTLCSASDLEIRVRLLPGHSGATVPVAVKLDAPVAGHCVRDVQSGRLIPFQYDKATRMLEFLIDAPVITRPTTDVFRLEEGVFCGADQLWIDSTEPKVLIVREGDNPVYVYNYGTQLPPGVPDRYRRSCYIHPLYGALGEVLTDDFPKDHYHHRGVAVMWTYVTVGGKTYDLWALNGMKPRFTKVLAMEGGPVYSLLKVSDGWYADGMKVADETWTVKTYLMGDRGRIVDFDIVLKAVKEPVTVKSSERGYGGFNIRFAPRTDTVLFSEKGKVPADTDKESFLWNDLSARFNGAEGVSGLAIFDNPRNVRHPEPWTNRYYGFMNPAPAAIEPLTFTAAEPLHLRYRMWIHEGDVEVGRVAQAYQAYVHPPMAEVSSR